MADIEWVSKLRILLSQQNKKVIELAAAIQMSEVNLHRCLKRGSIEVKHLIKIADFLNVPVSYFFDEGKGNATNIGKGNIAVSELKEKVQHLTALLAEKDKLIAEKERLIKMLLKEEKLR